MRRTETFGQSPWIPPSVGRIVRTGIYGLLCLVRPFMSLGLLVLFIVCIVDLLGSLTFPPGTHFPTLIVAGMAAGCVASNYAYGKLMDLVDPDR